MFGFLTGRLSLRRLTTASCILAISVLWAGLTPAQTISNFYVSPKTVTAGTWPKAVVQLSSKAPAGGATVSLQSDNANIVPPSSVTVPQGSTGVSFQIHTSALLIAQVANLTASLDSSAKSAEVDLTPGPLTGFYISPKAVIAGTSATGVVQVAVPAGLGGDLVSLHAGSPYIQVPATVTIPAGKLGVSFPINTTEDPSTSQVTVVASYNLVSECATMTLTGCKIMGFHISPDSVYGGDVTHGVIQLASPAGPNGVNVSVGPNSSVLEFPTTVTVPAGKTGVSFPIQTLNISTATYATVNVQLDSEKKSAKVNLSPCYLKAFYISPARVVGGQTARGVFQMSSISYPHGTVWYLDNSVSGITIPPAVVIPVGSSGVSFPITTSPVSAIQKVKIGGPGNPPYSYQVDLTVCPAPLTKFSLSKASMFGGQSAVGMVSLTGSVPSGGDWVALKSNNSHLSIPSGVTIPYGGTEASFSLGCVRVSLPEQATLTATLGDVTLSANITLLPDGLQMGSPWPKQFSGPANNGFGFGQGSTGSLKWSYPADSNFHSGASISADGTLYMGSETGALVAFDSATGAVKWSTTLEPNLTGATIGWDGAIYVGANGSSGDLFCVNPADGSVRWQHSLSGAITGEPAIVDQTILVGCKDGSVHAIDGANGSERWSLSTFGPIDSGVAVAPDGTAYVGSEDGNLYCFDGTTGQVKGAFTAWGPIKYPPVIGADGTVYIADTAKGLYALNGTTGALNWAATGVGNFTNPAIGPKGTLYAANDDGNVYALDPGNGSQVWTFQTGSILSQPPVVDANGTVYIGFNNGASGHVLALDGVAPSVTWDLTLPQNASLRSSLAIDAVGDLYFGTSQGVESIAGLPPDFTMTIDPTELVWDNGLCSGNYQITIVGRNLSGTIHISSPPVQDFYIGLPIDITLTDSHRSDSEWMEAACSPWGWSYGAAFTITATCGSITRTGQLSITYIYDWGP